MLSYLLTAIGLFLFDVVWKVRIKLHGVILVSVLYFICTSSLLKFWSLDGLYYYFNCLLGEIIIELRVWLSFVWCCLFVSMSCPFL